MIPLLQEKNIFSPKIYYFVGMYLSFTGKEPVSEILMKMPESAEILEAHGLSCASCHMNVSEGLVDGILGHGMTQKDAEIILRDLNEAACELKIPKEGRVSKNPELTEFAAIKIKEFQEEAHQKSYGFKIEVLPDTIGSAQYYLDFLEFPEKNDRVIESRGIKLFLDADSLAFLKNHIIDYAIDPQKGEGFKVIRIAA